MNLVEAKPVGIPAMSDAAISQVRRIEAAALECPQTAFTTDHVIHGGVYMRTLHMVPQSFLTGALIKISTTLVVSGDVTIFMDGDGVRVTGYHVLPASAGRKQAILAHDDTDLTMLFSTVATNVADAEAQFTDETNMLAAKHDDNRNTVLVTGE